MLINLWKKLTFINIHKVLINIIFINIGKRRLEPIGILIIACIMSVASFQVASESLKRIISQNDLIPSFSYASIGILCGNF